MKLKEKFIVVTGNYNNEELVLESIKIAEDFAIGFVEWLNFNFKLDFTDNAFKELLEIYKKEKGL